eukprot:gene7591-746_t
MEASRSSRRIGRSRHLKDNFAIVFWQTFLTLALLSSTSGSPQHVVRRGTNSIHHSGRTLLAPVRGDFAKPDYSIYHKKDDLLKKVEDIVAANPGTMSLEIKQDGDSNYNVSMQVVTIELGGLTKGPYASKVRFLVDFGEHGREFISSELGLRMMQTLADPEALKAVIGGGIRGERLIQLLHKIVFQILPMENVRGREIVEKGNLCERKNGRGVDTNRNYEIDWGVKEPDYNPDEEYPGTAPYSEPEVKIIRKLASSLKPHVWLNVHSGMEAMFVPWDHKNTVPEEAQPALQILREIHRDYHDKDCVVGSGGKSVGYLAHGTATDYMFSKQKVPMSYTWEIYGDFKAHYLDCFRMFNPVTKNQTEAILSKWLKSIFRLVELAPSHHAVAAELPKTDLSIGSHTSVIEGAKVHATALKAPFPPDRPLKPVAVPTPLVNNFDEKVTTKDSGIEKDFAVDIPESSSGDSGLWVPLLSGVAGMSVVAFLVYRYIRSTKTAFSGGQFPRGGNMV